MQPPSSRGALSEQVLRTLTGEQAVDPDLLLRTAETASLHADPLADDDLHLSLWLLYELHYRGFEGVSEGLEWHPDLLRLRRALEEPFETELRGRAAPYVADTLRAPGDLPERLFRLAEGFEGPPLAGYLHREADAEQFVEFLMHRSVYNLKESDPSAWLLPRIDGDPKAALAELLYDEYGGGRAERLHARLFADALEGCGLDRSYGAYVDRVPGYTLAANNVMSLLGLHRRLRGCAVGHLGAFEATSSMPCRRIAAGARRLGLPAVVAGYFDEHVEADAVHEQVALRDICDGMVRAGLATEEDVVTGAVLCLLVDAEVATRMLASWRDGASTLRGGGPQQDALGLDVVAS